MRVRYISGNQTGTIVEMGEEAAILLSNHIVERVSEDPDPTDAPEADPPVPSPADIEAQDAARTAAFVDGPPKTPTPALARTPRAAKAPASRRKRR